MNNHSSLDAFQAEQLIQHPHQVMEELVKKMESNTSSKIHEKMSQLYSNYFLNHDEQEATWKIIPSLNSMSAPNTVVRYRGIIQDMNNSELFTSSHLYRENSFIANDEDDQMNDHHSNLMERMLFYCIPIPGEAKWSRNTFYDDNVVTKEENNILNEEVKDVKRKRNDEDEYEMLETDDDLVESSDSKRRKETTCHTNHHDHSTTHSKTISREEMLDFPIKGEKGLACMVKLYDEEHELKNADIVDFVGIVTYEENVMRDEDEEDKDFYGIFTPEATLVPRLHVLFYKKYQHISYIVPNTFPITTANQISTVRESLIDYLSLCLKEDKLAAELLLLHLISRV